MNASTSPSAASPKRSSNWMKQSRKQWQLGRSKIRDSPQRHEGQEEEKKFSRKDAKNAK
jgi:hypothetical protein